MDFQDYFNPKRTPIAEITYAFPEGEYAGKRGILDLAPNPIITIVYEDGRKSVIDTNLIYKRGFERGIEKANNSIKKKLGLN
jgi:hypothetical protein